MHFNTFQCDLDLFVNLSKSKSSQNVSLITGIPKSVPFSNLFVVKWIRSVPNRISFSILVFYQSQYQNWSLISVQFFHLNPSMDTPIYKIGTRLSGTEYLQWLGRILNEESRWEERVSSAARSAGLTIIMQSEVWRYWRVLHFEKLKFQKTKIDA